MPRPQYLVWRAYRFLAPASEGTLYRLDERTQQVVAESNNIHQPRHGKRNAVRPYGIWRGLINRGFHGYSPGEAILRSLTDQVVLYWKTSLSGANILAVDISPDLLEIARKRKLPPNVALLEERFENCAIVKQFDVVIGSSILHHLEIETAMKKIFEILKPGGIIVFAEPNMMNPQIALQKNIPWLKK